MSNHIHFGLCTVLEKSLLCTNLNPQGYNLTNSVDQKAYIREQGNISCTYSTLKILFDHYRANTFFISFSLVYQVDFSPIFLNIPFTNACLSINGNHKPISNSHYNQDLFELLNFLRFSTDI